MALSEASNPAPGLDVGQKALENVGVARGSSGELGNSSESGSSTETVREESSPRPSTATGIFFREFPARLSGFDSLRDRGNVSSGSLGVRPSTDSHDSRRDGFPRGFSVVSPAFAGSRRMVENSDGVPSKGEITENVVRDQQGAGGMQRMVAMDAEDSSRSMAIQFDSETKDRVLIDDSPVRGGSERNEMTPEMGSFHLGQSEDSDVDESRLEKSLGSLAARRHDHKRHSYIKRKNSTDEKVAPVDGLPVKSQLYDGFVRGTERAHDAKRDGYISSRLFARPLAGREENFSNYNSPSPDAQAETNMGSIEITLNGGPGWSNVHPRGNRPEPRHFHAATVVGRRMVVVGGQTASGPSNDVQMLHLHRMMWSELGRGRAFANGQPGNLKASTPGPLPLCRGHSLISWGKTVLLIGGELNPGSDRVEVWSFDLEMECWTRITAKGEIPAARSGQSVTRAGSILIMFGGETPKGQKLNDLHILDLKSLMWLPLHTSGSGPSPRTKHCAAMYDDRYLLIFGGASKSKPLNDLFALDFETMEWSKMKTKGITPSPRSGHAGILVGDKWYIAGGETRGHGSTETLMLDVANLTWSGIAATTANTPVANQGLSLVLVQRKEKTMLVAFGGKGSEVCNQVQVLYIMPLDHVKRSSYSGNSEARDSQSNATAPSVAGSGLSCACVDVAKAHLSPLSEEHCSSRNSPGNSPLPEAPFDLTGVIPLRRRYGAETNESKYSTPRQPPEEILSRVLRETSSHRSSPLQQYKGFDGVHADLEMRGKLAPIVTRSSENPRKPEGSTRRKESLDFTLSSVMKSREYVDSRRGVVTDLSLRTKSHASDWAESLFTASQRHSCEGEECSDSQLLADLQDAMTMERRIHLINKYRQSFEMKLAAAVRRGELAEGQLSTALKGKEEAEKSLQLALKTRQHAEGKLAASLKGQMDLKERVAAAERAQEDSNNLCNVVHSENLRLEHDLAFLKAVLEDTQMELQSTRELLATERTRSFNLQMEVFDLKKKLPPSMLTGEGSESTPGTQLLPSFENVSEAE
ncbi:uncharacterized protein [Physcomitrium patens]|uniref:Uncharacterized protein n=2 Tax=Physcomitrium patens TaxID=3218 RepID=A0A2K1L6W3_PHYPA|nr:uncharacterized protein LOC112290208 isoform X2 [Physcomitrium patens]PNR61763.1 hypothetical protein PHYPA_000186 [Physcomitrium patens]|eukprot:XP_024392053.1 uncharacterized protein LOC112290208 isoform X2 [Physcomitrella patens]